MRASAMEFRLRMWIQVAIVFVGFWSPWIGVWDFGKRVSLLEWLALGMSRAGLVSFRYAAPAVIVAGSLVAFIGMALRIWGTAYLGYSVVHDMKMQAGGVMASGPYRYMRNPLYLGGWCMMIAMSLTMPPSGALFTIVLSGVFYLRLILGEEAHLASTLGEPYRAYLAAVPRLIPRLRSALPSAGTKPQWIRSALTEINPIGIFISVAVLSWSFDNDRVVEGIVISFAIAMLERGFIKAPVPTAAFVVAAAVAYWPLHLPLARALLIAFGLALIVRAAAPQRRKQDGAELPVVSQ